MLYFDHHAATPIAARVREAMAHAHAHAWANPESAHQAGRAARAVREGVRTRLATLLSAKPADLVLAGTGTEALHLGLLGLARSQRGAGRDQVVLSALEHPALRGAAQLLQAEGFRIHTLPFEAGRPSGPDELARALGAQTACAAMQWVNHETGTILPVREYAAVCRAHGVPLLVDACQALGKLPLDVVALGASALVVSAAKVGGPAGVSALWHERGLALSPVLSGGGQERGLRPGTPDVGALAGFGAALELLDERLAAAPRLAAERARIEQAAIALGALVNGAERERVGTVTNLSFPGWRADILVAALDLEGLCVSAGAACSSGVSRPSPVIEALYPDQPWRAEAAIRISLGPDTSSAEVDQAIAILERVIRRA
ncbi:MAG TPA: aminotransferase class V-fold PLP-dependent enzyme [Polyangiales bacterium]